MNTSPDTSPDHDETGESVAVALRDRVGDVRPDLERLVDVATSQGTRLRRRTRLAVSLGAAAGTGALFAVFAVGSSLAGSTPGARVESPGFAAEPSPPTASTPATTPVSTPSPTPPSHGLAHGEATPVILDLAGWTCGDSADEKMICSSGDRSALVTWRPADEHQAWLTDPDKTAPYVSDVHGDLFVTVVAGPHTSDAEARTVGHGLIWVSARSK